MSGARSMAAFMGDPGAWADPAQVAPLIVPGLAAETAARLMASPRTGRRASALLAAGLGTGDVLALPAADAALVLSSPETLLSLATAAGAVWHAQRVRALVMAADIAAFVARFGQAARDAAMRHAPPPGVADAAGASLAADVSADAARCIQAWIATLPPWAATRMRLVHPAASMPADHGPARAALLRRLAAEVLI